MTALDKARLQARKSELQGLVEYIQKKISVIDFQLEQVTEDNT